MEQLTPESSFPDLSHAHVLPSEGRHLPRWEATGAIYHIAFHLADSIPADHLRAWRATRDELMARCKLGNRPLTEDERVMLKALHTEHIERYLSAGYGECLLKNELVQHDMRDILSFGNGKDYALHVWCLMPNHLHVIVGSFKEPSDLSRTLTGWKRISGHKINHRLNRTGPVWRSDAYTHIIRSATEYKNQINYVWNNPEAAGLTIGFARERYVPGCA